MITLLLSLPRWVYALVACLFLLLGTYFYGHHKGWYERDAEMQAEIAKKNAEARQTEQKLNEAVAITSTKLQEANNAITQTQSALDRAIRAGRVRLPATSCVSTPQGSPAPDGNRDQARGEPDRTADQTSDADRATLAAIAEIVAQGDRNTAQLNACIDAYNEVRKQLNGDK